MVCGDAMLLFLPASLSGERNRKSNTINWNNSYFHNWGGVKSEGGKEFLLLIRMVPIANFTPPISED